MNEENNQDADINNEDFITDPIENVLEDELENAIVNLVITLSKKKAETIGTENAKKDVALFLGKIAGTLNSMNEQS